MKPTPMLEFVPERIVHKVLDNPNRIGELLVEGFISREPVPDWVTWNNGKTHTMLGIIQREDRLVVCELDIHEPRRFERVRAWFLGCEPRAVVDLIESHEFSGID